MALGAPMVCSRKHLCCSYHQLQGFLDRVWAVKMNIDLKSFPTGFINTTLFLPVPHHSCLDFQIIDFGVWRLSDGADLGHGAAGQYLNVSDVRHSCRCFNSSEIRAHDAPLCDNARHQLPVTIPGIFCKPLVQ